MAAVAAGNAFSLARSPSSPAILFSPPEYASLCTLPSAGCQNEGQYPYLVGLDFVPDGNLWVASVYSGDVYEVAAGNRSVIAGLLPHNCSLVGQFYPGTGDYLFLQCASNPVDSIQEFDWRTAQVVATIPLDQSGYQDDYFAFDPAAQRLYCAETYGSPHLLSIDLGSGSIVANVSLPTPQVAITPLWFDARTGDILFDDPAHQSLAEIQPSTGSVQERASYSGNLTALAYDPHSHQLYLGSPPSPDRIPLGGNVTVLNSSTLEEVSTLLGAGGDEPLAIIVDPASEELLVDDFARGLTIFDSVTDAFLGHIPVVEAWTPVAYDSATGTLAGTQQRAFGDPVVGFLNFSRTQIASADFSAVPGVGTALPLVVAVVGSLVAVPVVARYLLRKWRTEDGRPAPDSTWP